MSMRIIRVHTITLLYQLLLLPAVAVAQTPAVQPVSDTSRFAWTPSTDNATITSYRADLYALSDVTFVNGDYVPNAGTNPLLTVDQGKPTVDATGTQTGPPIRPALQPSTAYVAFLRAVAGNATSDLSNSSGAFAANAILPPPDPCSSPVLHNITLIVQDWTRSVPVGSRGRVLWQLLNAQPVVQLQIKLGTQVIAQIDGTDLRDSAGTYFSVPRTPGTYSFTVFAKDATGCTTETTTVRTFIVF
jgi:hypothetical protein